MNWKNVKFEKMESIEKCVPEFKVSALRFLGDFYEGDFIPYGGFNVKIYETQDLEETQLLGYTNLGLKSFIYDEDGSKIPTGDYEISVGCGNTISRALESTIKNFRENVINYRNEKNAPLTKDDFHLVNYDEF